MIAGPGFPRLFLVAVLVLGLNACCLGAPSPSPCSPATPSPAGSPPPMDKSSIARDYKVIKTHADRALLDPDPVQSFRRILPILRKLPTVEKAWVESGSLFVSFKNGGTISWEKTPPLVVPPWDGSAKPGPSPRK